MAVHVLLHLGEPAALAPWADDDDRLIAAAVARISFPASQISRHGDCTSWLQLPEAAEHTTAAHPATSALSPANLKGARALPLLPEQLQVELVGGLSAVGPVTTVDLAPLGALTAQRTANWQRQRPMPWV